jgi:hypothetical protein
MSGESPGYLYWEEPEPDAKWDSGWRIFVGDEMQADVDDPSNFQINALEALVAEHPALESLFVEGRRGSWEWDPQLETYRPAADPQA